jgi:L-threonylcarbamoyladenylate synthase
MKVIKINIQNINKASIINQIKAVFAQGKLLVYPTDTLYGLGTDPYNSESIIKLNNVKGRSAGQEISVAIPDIVSLKKLCVTDPLLIRIYERFLPGPLTIITNAGDGAPQPVVTPEGTIGIRTPNDPLVLELLKLTGPITSTSANRHGGSNPVSIEIAVEQLGDSVDLYLDAGQCKHKEQSTILDITKGVPRILRDGVISRKKLEEELDCKVD